MSLYRLTVAADRDIAAILHDTAQHFGARQRDHYAIIIRIGIEMVASEPERPGSRPRDELAPGVRSFHLELAAGRAGAAAHQIYYNRQDFADGGAGVAILRVLHERMEPRYRIGDTAI